MTPEESYTMLILAIKATAFIFAIIIFIAIVLYVLGHTPDFPRDDGERM